MMDPARPGSRPADPFIDFACSGLVDCVASQLSVQQIEFSAAQAVDRPLSWRIFFDQLIRDNLRRLRAQARL